MDDYLAQASCSAQLLGVIPSYSTIGVNLSELVIDPKRGMMARPQPSPGPVQYLNVHLDSASAATRYPHFRRCRFDC